MQFPKVCSAEPRCSVTLKKGFRRKLKNYWFNLCTAHSSQYWQQSSVWFQSEVKVQQSATCQLLVQIWRKNFHFSSRQYSHCCCLPEGICMKNDFLTVQLQKIDKEIDLMHQTWDYSFPTVSQVLTPLPFIKIFKSIAMAAIYFSMETHYFKIF